MSENIDYVGIDVDDTSYQGCALDQRTGAGFLLSPDIEGLGGTTREVA